jgi:anti-anti-sigma factor
MRATRPVPCYLIGSTVDDPAAHDTRLSLTSRAGPGGCKVAVLRGELDIASATALREKLLGLLSPAASRLIVDLSAAGYADASGVAVLASSERRARLLGGWLRLVSPAPEVAEVLSVTGVGRHVGTFPTIQAAIIGQSPDIGAADARTGRAGRVAHIQPLHPLAMHARSTAGGGDLRTAITAVLTHADAWRDADPHRRFTPALHALARAYAGTSDAALTQAADSLLAILGREPLTHSPEVAATASHLRRLFGPEYRPPADAGR